MRDHPGGSGRESTRLGTDPLTGGGLTLITVTAIAAVTTTAIQDRQRTPMTDPISHAIDSGFPRSVIKLNAQGRSVEPWNDL
ncbi:hypothetical protein ACFQ9X_35115 [Catenulispora yoronensis]